MSGIDQVARTAIERFIGRALVFFIPGAAQALPEHISSGTVFATTGGHVVVLTAQHCARDAQDMPIRLGYYEAPQVIQDAVAGITHHPDKDLDVALMVLKRHAREALRSFALAPDSIADDEVDPSDTLWLAGFPSKLVARSDPRGFGAYAVTYGTSLADPARDATARYRVLWTERETPSGNIEMWDPEGISGGALWRFRGDPNHPVWSPTGRMRLAGVPVAWRASERVELAEPSAKWKSWVLGAMAEIDADERLR